MKLLAWPALFSGPSRRHLQSNTLDSFQHIFLMGTLESQAETPRLTAAVEANGTRA